MNDLSEVKTPYSFEDVKNLVAIEREHVAIQKSPELSCGCGCDIDDNEIDSWTDEDYSFFCKKSFEDPDLCQGGDIDESEESWSYYGKVPYPCPTLLNARASASTEILVEVALILGGENK